MSEEYDDYDDDEGGGSGIPSIFIYIGGLIGVNAVLLVVDAPLYLF